MINVMHYVSIMDRGGQESYIMNLFRSIDTTQVLFNFLCVVSRKGDYDDEIIQLGGRINHLDIQKNIKIVKPIVTFLKLCYFF